LSSAAAAAPPIAVLAPAPPFRGGASEGVRATRNALTLGSTLVAGMALSLLVRLFVVRFLGPEAFGELRFAENAAEMIFVGLTLGVDTLIRREAAVAPERARSYLWGLLALRLVAGAVLMAGIATGLALTGYTSTVVLLFIVLGTAQLLIVLNNSYSALEHASGSVGWIARVTLSYKALWAAAAVGVLVFFPSGLHIAAALLGVEALRFARLSAHSVRRVGVELRPDLRLAGGAAVASLPFFVHYLAHSLYARLGVWWLGGTVGELEVGWYGSASTLAAIAMLGMPLISWVLVPSASRAAKNGGDEMQALIGGALRMSLLVAVPVSLVAAVWAPLWVRLLFGADYLPAVPALRALAPTFTLAYVASICSISLIQRERVRAIALVSLGGLGVAIAMNAVLIPWTAARLATPGAAAAGAAYATLLTEIAVTAVMIRLAWAAEWTVSILRTVAGLAVAAGAAYVTFGAAAGLAGGAPLAAAAVFVLVLGLTGTIHRADVAFARSVLRGKREHGEAGA
jgi:O-antigen/teichoic acid export membrane protein